MKTRCLISLMVAVAVMLFSQPALADDLADLKATYMTLWKAANTGDVETMFEIMHDGRIFIGAEHGFPLVMTDRARTKQVWAKIYETHRIRIMWYKPDFRVVGNTGLVWGHTEISIMSKNGSGTRHSLQTSLVFVKSEGKWKLILQQYTPVPQTVTLY